MLPRQVLRRVFVACRALEARSPVALAQFLPFSTGNAVLRASSALRSREIGGFRLASTESAAALDISAEDAPIEPESAHKGTSVDEFELSPRVKDALKRAGFESLFAVQSTTLPHVLAGRDVIVRARTGTGKTLGFVIPVVQFCEQNDAAGRPPRARKPLCLVMTPTRELAIQVEGEFEKVGNRLGLKSVCLYGGAPAGPQVSEASIDARESVLLRSG